MKEQIILIIQFLGVLFLLTSIIIVVSIAFVDCSNLPTQIRDIKVLNCFDRGNLSLVFILLGLGILFSTNFFNANKT